MGFFRTQLFHRGQAHNDAVGLCVFRQWGPCSGPFLCTRSAGSRDTFQRAPPGSSARGIPIWLMESSNTLGALVSWLLRAGCWSLSSLVCQPSLFALQTHIGPFRVLGSVVTMEPRCVGCFTSGSSDWQAVCRDRPSSSFGVVSCPDGGKSLGRSPMRIARA